MARKGTGKLRLASFNYDEFLDYDLAFLTPKFPPVLQVEIEYEGLIERDHLDTMEHDRWSLLDHRENGEHLAI